MFSFVLATTLYAQKDVTTFLGIPIDGTKEEMIQKLKAKGFSSSSYNREILEGEFNGRDVLIFISTNNNKVCRIAVADKNKTDIQSVKIRFNTLCRQFGNNSKYMSLNDYVISDDENIRYEILVNKKRYEAIFYQKPEDLETMIDDMRSIILSKYSQEELANPTKEMMQQIESDMKELSINEFINCMTKRPVWFMISELFGEYYITIYYDNEYNRAQGEDL